MNNYLAKMFELKFLKDVEQYVNAYEILINNNCKKEADNYALCFYSSFLGFLHKVYSTNRSINSMIFNSLSIDLGIIYDLDNYIYDEKEDTYSNSVIYCYNKASAIPYKHIEYVLNYFFKLHTKIAISSKISTDEEGRIENTKKLMCNIKQNFKIKET